MNARLNKHSRPALRAPAWRVAGVLPRKGVGARPREEVGECPHRSVWSVQAEWLSRRMGPSRWPCGGFEGTLVPLHPLGFAVLCRAAVPQPCRPWYCSYSGRPGKRHSALIKPSRPRRVRLTSGSLKSSGSGGPGGGGRGPVVVRTPLLDLWTCVGARGWNSSGS